MALLTSELTRLKAELGFNLLNTGAEPYIGVTAVFSQIIAVYMTAGAVTTSSTAVSASAVPSQAAITLASAAGFTAGDRIILDVDGRQEAATVESLSGAVATGLLSKVHSGTYAVTVEGGESIVRENLTNIREVKARMAKAFGAGSLKAVDEVQFYETKGQTLFGAYGEQLMFWRDELASNLGLRRKNSSSGAQRLAVY